MKSICLQLGSIAISVFVMSSCGSAQYASTGSYMASQNYQSREELKQSVFGNQSQALSDKEVQKVLNSKVRIPKKARLAVIRLPKDYKSQSGFHTYYWSSKAMTLNQQIVDEFLGTLKASEKTQSVVLLPSLLVPAPIHLESLRTAAIRVQADLLLVLYPQSYVDYDAKLFSANQAKAQSTVESFLLDTRTGVIVYTGVAAKTLTVNALKSDSGRDETVRRVQQKAESEAMVQLAQTIAQFLARAGR